jgi:beta-lactamase regulating signal transducer with metallopeptidase domain
MNLLIEFAIKISLVVALGLLAVSVLHRRSASLRHWLLAASMAAALATPLLVQWAPAWRLPVRTSVESNARAIEPSQTTSRREPRIGITTSVDPESLRAASRQQPVDPTSIVIAVWMVGVAVNLTGLLLGFWRLRRIAASATIVREGSWVDITRTLSAHFGLTRPVTLLQSDRPASLVTWGFITPKVLLPIDAGAWDVDRIRVVMAHELAHVRRHDWVIQIGAELLRIANWFNPVVWLASARLRLESERACDDAVVNLGVSGHEYAEHLLDLARQFGRNSRMSFPAVAIVPRPSNLERRVTAMLNAHVSRRPISPFARAATLLALLAVAIPIALVAQNRFSTLSGSVTDPSGGLLPGVTVVAVDTTRDARHEVKTNSAGQFEIIGLPDGPLVLEATLPGFQKYQQKLTLDGQDVNRNISLRIGALQETISVTRGAGPIAPSFEARPVSPKPAPPACGASAAGRGTARTGIVPLRIGGQIRQPTKTRHVSPFYPEGSSPGVVLLEAVIGPEGLVTDVKVLRNPGQALALAAENAVRQWEFTPTLLNCEPVPVIMTVTVDFN